MKKQMSKMANNSEMKKGTGKVAGAVAGAKQPGGTNGGKSNPHLTQKTGKIDHKGGRK